MAEERRGGKERREETEMRKGKGGIQTRGRGKGAEKRRKEETGALAGVGGGQDRRRKIHRK